MNSDTFEGKWEQLKGKVKAAWGELTDDDLTRINGKVEQLNGLIRERYGRTKEQAETEIRAFLDRHK
ncbi:MULTISPECIES: CsbD family protein [Microvirgula]|uniref:CsbD family protein n=1 Tax=Microvirgula aerodenitrificans TaxID=57480 RepID=A0A2S0PAD1_9NEIS|nr:MULTISPECIES: CsbD family protein [Microvirgula]AVY94350.1 CsbD family protein [Microvirgula aerodenitrificans]RAS19233.1 uncharacterized protein YjbJ (UPF0337 family) [Microvirgula sp. AG722]